MAHFGERVEEGVGDEVLAGLVASRLRASCCLVVMDNVETLLTAEGRRWQDEGYGQFLLDWLGEPGRSVVMVTSREEPDVPNNLMRYCRWHSLDGLAVEAGVALLDELGVLGEKDAVSAFVTEANGHPLLLKLVAGWLLVEEPEEPRLEYLNQDVDGLNVFEFVGAHRGQPETSVRKILEATLNRLPAQMRELLPALSLYRLPFSLAAAQVMSSESLTEADLQRLTKRALLQSKKQTVDGKRIRLFEFQPLVQRYLRAGADSAGHYKAVEHYQQVRKPSLGTSDDLADTVAYQEIFHHYCELNEHARALATIRFLTDENERYSSCDMVLQLRGHNAVRLTLYERLIQCWRPEDDDERRMQGDALQAMGDVLQFLDRRDEAVENYDEALGIYRQVGDRLGEANTLKAMGRSQENIQKGIAYLQSAQALYEQIGDIYSQGVNLFYLGGMYAQLDQLDKAVAAFEKAISMGQEIDFLPLVEAAENVLNQLRTEN